MSLASSDIALKFDWKVMNENLGSDHLVLQMSIDISPSPKYKIGLNYKKAQWHYLRTKTKEDLSNYVMATNNQSAYDSFIKIMINSADKHIPSTKVCENPLRTKKFRPKPYASPELSKSVALRRRALAQFRINPTPEKLERLKGKTADAQSDIRQAKAKAWQSLCDSISNVTTTRDMWLRMKWVKGYKSSKPTVDRDKAEAMLYSLTPDFVCPDRPEFISTNRYLCATVSVQELNNCLERSDTAPGADDK